MSLMLLSQAELFSDRGLLGLDSNRKLVMSKDGNIVISYHNGSDNNLQIYKKVPGGWNRVTRIVTTENGWLLDTVKISNDGYRVAYSYSNTGSFFANRITVMSLNYSDLSLTLYKTLASTVSIWDFDVNFASVIYVTPNGQVNLNRLAGSSVQAITLPNTFSNLSVWFTDDSSFDFKWSGQPDNSNNAYLGQTVVTSESTYTNTTLRSSPPSYSGLMGDFAQNSFTFVTPSASNDIALITSTGQQNIATISIGLGGGSWRFEEARCSSDGAKVIALAFNPVSGEYRLCFFSKNSSGVFNHIATITPRTSVASTFSGDRRLALDAGGTSLILRCTLGPQSYII
jgi:hypothetical protein